MTARPGTVKKIVENPLPRPRDSTIVSDPEFGRLSGELWESLREESMRALAGERAMSEAGTRPRGPLGPDRWRSCVLLEIIPRLGLVNPIALVPLSEMVWQLWLLLSDGILGDAHRAHADARSSPRAPLAVVTGLPLGVLLWRLETTAPGPAAVPDDLLRDPDLRLLPAVHRDLRARLDAGDHHRLGLGGGRDRPQHRASASTRCPRCW